MTANNEQKFYEIVEELINRPSQPTHVKDELQRWIDECQHKQWGVFLADLFDKLYDPTYGLYAQSILYSLAY